MFKGISQVIGKSKHEDQTQHSFMDGHGLSGAASTPICTWEQQSLFRVLALCVGVGFQQVTAPAISPARTAKLSDPSGAFSRIPNIEGMWKQMASQLGAAEPVGNA